MGGSRKERRWKRKGSRKMKWKRKEANAIMLSFSFCLLLRSIVEGRVSGAEAFFFLGANPIRDISVALRFGVNFPESNSTRRKGKSKKRRGKGGRRRIA